MRVLVTGGAGFVGSHLCDELIRRGHRVRVYDSLERQVHPRGRVPSYLSSEVELVHGDVRDRERVKKAMEGTEILFHQAAYVGVGQSMYEIRRYVEGNSVGGATVLDVLANERHSIRRVVVASSMSIYGEGCYRCDACETLVAPELRARAQMAAHEWELRCPDCGAVARPVGTPEEKALRPTSVYAITKRDHEEMFLSVGQAYGIPTVALRYFNIFGSRQALSNPYTGVMAIFSGRLLTGNAPVVYEDGKQTRDFVHVSDIVQANMLAMENSAADYQTFNVGTGRATSVLDVANMLMDHLDMHVTPDIRKQFREGDIRHCVADISKIRRLGYEPKVRLEDGLEELVEWVREQSAEDTFEHAAKELAQHGLLR